MSVITDMVIFTTNEEDAAIRELNEWCRVNDTERHQQFKDISTEDAGGSKIFTSYIWAMAGNFFEYEKLVEAFSSFKWRYPEDVVFIYSHENQETFTYRIES